MKLFNWNNLVLDCVIAVREYLAEKTEACKAEYAPMAHLEPSDIIDEDLVKAMSFAPTETIYRA